VLGFTEGEIGQGAKIDDKTCPLTNIRANRSLVIGCNVAVTITLNPAFAVVVKALFPFGIIYIISFVSDPRDNSTASNRKRAVHFFMLFSFTDLLLIVYEARRTRYIYDFVHIVRSVGWWIPFKVGLAVMRMLAAFKDDKLQDVLVNSLVVDGLQAIFPILRDVPFHELPR